MITNALASEIALLALSEILMRRRNGKVANALMQELKGIHANTTLKDLPQDYKNDLKDVGQIVIAYLGKAGFKVVPKET